MTVPFIDLKLQYKNLKSEIDNAVLDVLSNCHFIMGPNVKSLEEEIAKFLNVKHVIACASGSDAILLSLMAYGIKQGDEVITTPFTFFATAGAIVRLGAKPVFVDIDAQTYNINPSLVKEKITSKTKAIIPVHIYGQAADLDPLKTIAAEHNIALIEDCAQAFGAKYKNKYVATIGDLGCISFFPTKNLGCFGDGGAITTNNDTLAEKLRLLRLHGAKPKYYHKLIGINSRLDEIQAAILRVKLKYISLWNSTRQNIAQKYNTAFRNTNITIPYAADYGRHIYHQYAIKIGNRDKVLEFLKSNKIEAGIYYPLSMHLQECFKELGYSKGDLPVSENTTETILSLPIFAEMTEDQINFVAEKVIEAEKLYNTESKKGANHA